MQPDLEDRYIETPQKSAPPWALIIGAVLVITAVLGWYLTQDPAQQPEIAAPAPAAVTTVLVAAPEPELPPAPDIPEPETVVLTDEAPEEPVVVEEPPLTLADSDALLRESMATAGDSPLLTSALINDNLLERSIALVDSFSRGIVMQKLLPVPPPKGGFAVVEQDEQLIIDPASYQRYDAYAEAIAELDTATMVSLFHRLRPLLEQTYAGLGYDAADFDNALMRAIDRILATPRIDEPIEVVKDEAIYKLVDPALEQRPALQKQLLRMGPENIERIQGQAQALRSGLLAVQP